MKHPRRNRTTTFIHVYDRDKENESLRILYAVFYFLVLVMCVMVLFGAIK